MLKKLLFASILSIAALFSTPLFAEHPETDVLMKKAKKAVKAISPKDLKKMIDDEKSIYMIDIREPDMRVEGTLDGPENIEIARGLIEFEMMNQLKDKNAFIVVYCRSGKGALLAAETIQDRLGYKNVNYLEGGIQGWMDAGYSIYNHFGEVKLVQ